MSHLPIEALLLLSIITMFFSVMFRDNIKKHFHPAIPYFVGVALFLCCLLSYLFPQSEYTYELAATQPIEFSEGGEINFFFEYNGELYDATEVIEMFDHSKSKVYIYSSEEDKSFFRSVFKSDKDLKFRSSEDTYILRLNRKKEIRE